MPELQIEDLSPEQRELWQRVNDLWSLSLERNAERIRSTLHPAYSGWDMNSGAPHDREAAVQSVLGDAPTISEYHLQPLAIQVYDGFVGIVHYTYSAVLAPEAAAPFQVSGKWSEIYLKQSGQWIMIGVSGRPDKPSGDAVAFT